MFVCFGVLEEEKAGCLFLKSEMTGKGCGRPPATLTSKKSTGWHAPFLFITSLSDSEIALIGACQREFQKSGPLGEAWCGQFPVVRFFF